MLLTGCRVDVGTDVAFDRSGGGEVAVSVRVDGATLRALDAAGVDPGLDVAIGLGPGTAWQAQRTIDADGGLVLTYRRAFEDGAGATALLEELSVDVDPEDPALRLDLVVDTSRSGAVRISGTGQLSPPATLGVSLDDVPVGPVDEELAALVARSVRAQLVVHVPGRIVAHDADLVEGGTLRWSLPVGEPRDVLLVADPLPWWRRVSAWVVAVAGAGVATLLVARRRVAGRSPTGGEQGSGGIDPAGLSPAE
jgi:hypothetical protein